MKTLHEIIKNIDYKVIKGNTNIYIEGIAFDSREVKNNYLFVAIKGTNTDGHNYIQQAIEKGACAILCQRYQEIENNERITIIVTNDTASALGIIASEFFDNPSQKLTLVGVTGTNGKTTTVTLLYRLCMKMGKKAGLLSTIVNYINEKEIPSTHTTPDPLQINKFLSEMVKEGCEYAFMEVSSHAAHQKRIAGLKFKGGIFTNITHDHLDYHKTFDEYLKAKKLFFDNLSSDAFALINVDDKNSKIIVQNTEAKIYTYALHKIADFQGKIIESHIDGMLLRINNNEVWVKLIGAFNAYNILAVYGCVSLLNFDQEKVLQYISNFDTVNGRFEYYKSKDGITAIVDYAHTPDALLNVLTTINQLRKRDEKIITVVGAGGNRDKTKRPKMAAVCLEYSDKVILTSDNPRFEDPLEIIKDMESGIDPKDKNRYLVIPDRKEAIKTACNIAQPGDIVLIAGKGHETYQEIKGIKYYFNDKDVVKEIFNI